MKKHLIILTGDKMKKNLFVIVSVALIFVLTLITQLFTPKFSHAVDNTWMQVESDGFGTPNNSHIHSLTIFQSQLYIGTDNEIDGAELFRTSNGTNWTKIIGTGLEGNHGPGFGNKENFEIHAISEFNSYLYAGVYNPTSGAEIWRSADGQNWEKIVGKDLSGTNNSGFGNKENIDIQSMIIFNSKLYAGTWNNYGAEVWESENGRDWKKSTGNGFGDNDNQIVITLAVFNQNLYAGTSKYDKPAEIWRTADGGKWEQVNTEGFGDASNRSIDTLVVFLGKLYAGITNYYGAEIYNTENGNNWSKIVGSGLDGNNNAGFGNNNNRGIWTLYSSDNILYAGTFNENGTEIWTTKNGADWNKIVGKDLAGTSSSGFRDANNWAIYAFCKFDNYLYAGTDSSYYDKNTDKYLSKTGFEMWREKLYDKPVPSVPPSTERFYIIWIIIGAVAIILITVLVLRYKKKNN